MTTTTNAWPIAVPPISNRPSLASVLRNDPIHEGRTDANLEDTLDKSPLLLRADGSGFNWVRDSPRLFCVFRSLPRL